MTETPRPVPGPLRPQPAPAGDGPDLTDRLADRLADLPVAEHAAQFELEHAHLQRRLATIDQL